MIGVSRVFSLCTRVVPLCPLNEIDLLIIKKMEAQVAEAKDN